MNRLFLLAISAENIKTWHPKNWSVHETGLETMAPCLRILAKNSFLTLLRSWNHGAWPTPQLRHFAVLGSGSEVWLYCRRYHLHDSHPSTWVPLWWHLVLVLSGKKQHFCCSKALLPMQVPWQLCLAHVEKRGAGSSVYSYWERCKPGEWNQTSHATQ